MAERFRYQNFDSETGRPYMFEEAQREAAKAVAALTTGAALSDEDIDMWGTILSETGHMPPMGRGKEGTRLRKLIMERAASATGSASDAYDAAINKEMGAGLGTGISEGLGDLFEETMEGPETPRRQKTGIV